MTLERLDDFGAQRVEGREGVTVGHLNDVVAIGREHRLRHFAFLECVGSGLKLLYQGTGTEFGQLPAALRRTGVGGIKLSHFGKVGTSEQGVIDRVGLLLGRLLLRLAGVLLELDKDVRGLDYVHAAELLLGAGVHVGADGVDEELVHHVRRELHIAVSKEFFFERFERVELRSLSSGDFEFVVYKHRHVFFDGLLLYRPLYVSVFVVGIFKFGARDVLSVDGHEHGVAGGLCHCGQAEGEKERKQSFLHVGFCDVFIDRQ